MSEDKYHIVDPEEVLECPYDKTHMIRAKRFPYHLMKCRMNHPGTDYGTCPFNARHEVPKPELRFHISNCPDRCRIDLDIVYETQKGDQNAEIFKGCTDVPTYNNVPLAPATEDWDSEVPDGADRYVHMPVIYKDNSSLQAIQQRQLQQYFLGKGKPRPDQSEDRGREEVRGISVASNPIYAMSMAGIGRGRIHRILQTQQLDDSNGSDGQLNTSGLTKAQQLMAIVGRGRGLVMNKPFKKGELGS